MRRTLSGVTLGLIAALAAAAPAGAATLTIQAPAASSPTALTNVVYAGSVDGDPMMLRTYYEQNAASCGATSAEQASRGNSQFDGSQYLTPENPAFNVTSAVTLTTGIFRFCAYLETGLEGAGLPPVARAEAVVNVGNVQPGCKVPNVRKLTLAAATKKITAAGCKLGKVKKPKKAGKKKLIVGDQSSPPGLKVQAGAKVDLTLVVKKKK
jgi:hypothetical protein